MNEIIGNATHEQLYPTSAVTINYEHHDCHPERNWYKGDYYIATVGDWQIRISHHSHEYTLKIMGANETEFGERAAHNHIYRHWRDDTMSLDDVQTLAAEIIASDPEKHEYWITLTPGSDVSVEGKGRARNVEHKPVAPFVSPRMEDNEPSFF